MTISTTMDPIDTTRILDALDESTRQTLALIEAFPVIASTSSYLLEQPAPAKNHWRYAIADQQSAGRGRMNNEWFSPPSSGLYLSGAYTFEKMPAQLPSLTLAVGAAIAAALRRLGVAGVQLKWPNDLVLNDGKLGGILSETRANSKGAATVVIGVGINLDLGDSADKLHTAIGRVADMKEALAKIPERYLIAARVIEALVTAVQQFAAQGLAPVVDDWNRLDWLQGREVTIESAAKTIAGKADGIDADGALRIRNAGEIVRVTSGSVMLAEAGHR